MYHCHSTYSGVCSPRSGESFDAFSYRSGSALETIAYSASSLPSSDSYVVFPPLIKPSPVFLAGRSSSRYEREFSADRGYSSSSLSSHAVYELFHPHQEYHFQPEHFLRSGKEGGFIGNAEEIRSFVEETFEKVMGKAFPTNIRLTLCDEKTFRILAPSPGVIGLSFNRRKSGLVSEVFVLEGSLGRVLLTVGHEIGHVLSDSRTSAMLEEAKAYAFSFAWMDIVKEYNIAGLGNAIISELPAVNGVHDLGFELVTRKMKSGQRAWEVYDEIVNDQLAVLTTL